MQKPRVMIVEDEAIVAADMAATLDEMGYEIASLIHTGEDAVRHSEIEKPDIVLMDILLAGKINGIEAAELIKKRNNIPVIFVTAYSDDAIIDRAKKTEPAGYIVKPISSRELRIALDMALYKHKAELEREKLLRELQTALSQIKTLKGLLPICAWCKRIRNDKGYWDSVEAFIEDHTEATFTHGICPNCLKKAEKDLAKDSK